MLARATRRLMQQSGSPTLGAARGLSSAPPQSYECRAAPAPGSPFHHAFPVHCLDAARAFYGGVLGCEEGRTSAKWIGARRP